MLKGDFIRSLEDELNNDNKPKFESLKDSR